jgi:hypothetical protein
MTDHRIPIPDRRLSGKEPGPSGSPTTETGTGNNNLPEKRGQAKSANRTPRKARMAWSRLYCLKSVCCVTDHRIPSRGRRLSGQ